MPTWTLFGIAASFRREILIRNHALDNAPTFPAQWRLLCMLRRMPEDMAVACGTIATVMGTSVEHVGIMVVRPRKCNSSWIPPELACRVLFSARHTNGYVCDADPFPTSDPDARSRSEALDRIGMPYTPIDDHSILIRPARVAGERDLTDTDPANEWTLP